MKNGLFICILIQFLIAAVSLPAQTTAFTYQGRLLDGGQPANGNYDLRFVLVDAATNGNYLVAPLTNAPALVSNGLFTVMLDFGASVFDGSARWLEIGVRTNGSTGAFTALAPRQLLTPAPYSLYASNAATAANVVPGGNVSSGSGMFSGTITASNVLAKSNVKWWGAKGDGTNDDTVAIQSAINEAQLVGGKVYLPVGDYLLTTSLVITSSIAIGGECVGSLTKSYMPTIPPYLTGTVLLMKTSNTDAILITASTASVGLENIGIKFASAISFIATGNGITTLPPIDVVTGYPAIGIQDSTWNNVMVFGTDGNHYAFYLVNAYLNTFKHLHSYGGGGIHTFANNDNIGTGNNLFEDTYAIIGASGTSHGYYLHGTDNGGGQQYLNTFVRMQANKLTNYPTLDAAGKGLTAPTTNQYNLYADAYNEYLSIFAPDFEDFEGGAVYIDPALPFMYMSPGVAAPGYATAIFNFANALGIKTSTPVQPLDVNGKSVFRDYSSYSVGTNAYNGYIGSANAVIGIGNSQDYSIQASAGNMYVGSSSSNIYFTVGALTEMAVLNNGRVGVGTAIPLSRFSLGANTAAYNSANSKICVLDAGGYPVGIGLSYYNSQYGLGLFDGDTAMSGVPKMFLTSTGVGINTTTVANTLSVNGDIGAQTIILTNNPTFLTTNVAPSGYVTGVTVPVIWFGITNTGKIYLIPGFAP